MSSEDHGVGSYHQQTQTPGPQTCTSQTLSNCVGLSNNSSSSNGGGGSTGGGRKRSSHYHQQQHQQHHYKDSLESKSSGTTGLYTMDPNDSQMSHGTTNYNSNASPSRYYNSDTYLLGGRITAVPQEK